MTDTEKYDFALFIGTMLRRSASQMEHRNSVIEKQAADPTQQLELFEEILPTLASRYQPDEIEETRAQILRGELVLSVDRAKAVQMQVWIDHMPQYCRIIADMHWQVWRAGKGLQFVTSDAPAFVRRFGHDDDLGVVGIAQSRLRAELYFPLSKRALLVAKHERCPRLQTATKTRVKELNSLVIRMAFKHLFSSSLDEKITQLVLRNNHFSPPLPNLER